MYQTTLVMNCQALGRLAARIALPCWLSWLRDLQTLVRGHTTLLWQGWDRHTPCFPLPACDSSPSARVPAERPARSGCLENVCGLTRFESPYSMPGPGNHLESSFPILLMNN